MSLYGYENRQAQLHRIVTIHTAGCGHCQDGKGNPDASNRILGKWHGPFTSLEHARGELNKLHEAVAVTSLHGCVATPEPAAAQNEKHDEEAALSRMEDDGGATLTDLTLPAVSVSTKGQSR